MALFCLLCLLSDGTSAGVYSCTDCIVISSQYGKDTLSCLQRNNSFDTPCQSLSYVFSNHHYSLSDDTEVIVQGHHWLNQTLTVSNVRDLTLRGGGDTSSVIKCPPPSHAADQGHGFVFESVSGLKVHNVVFEGCGTLQYSTTIRDSVSIKYRSAVYIINSTDVNLSETSFFRNIGKGLSLHDVDGQVHVSNSTFRENMVSPNELFGGGSIYIEFTHCSPGKSRCNSTTNTHNKHSRYLIKNCFFESNRATNREFIKQSHIVQFSIFDGKNAGQGGGLHIIIQGMSFNNSIVVDNCTFRNNSAVFGGGIDTLFLNSANSNTLHVKDCIFASNFAPQRGGGAVQLGFYGSQNVIQNMIHVQDTLFVNNSAGWGAAIAFFSSLSHTDLENSLDIYDCVFEGNSASIGAAIALKPSAVQSVHDGRAPITLLHNCTFVRNRIINNGTFLNIANDGISKHVLESGILDVASSNVKFSKYMSFIENSGSAVVANSGQVDVLENANVVFVNNTATNGGAMALLGFSVLELYPGSSVVFQSNISSELGGAVYATAPNQLEFVISHKCFISFKGPNSHDPEKWNTKLVFVDNSARYGSAIFTDSVLPCVKQIGNLYTNISAAFRWNSFQILPEIQEYTIATSPGGINFTVPQVISPGENIDLNITSLDDLDQVIPSSFKVTLDSDGGVVTTNDFVSEDGHLQIRGDPDTNFSLTLLTQNTRHVSATMSGRLGNCPIGFVLDGDTCECSTGTRAQLVGVIGCDMVRFQAFLQVGYWIGCSNTKTLTGICPFSYCNYNNDGSSTILIPRTCDDLLKSSVCSEHRRGQLCGECEEGYSAYFHSEKFSCGECRYGALGLLIYIVAELTPLIIVFVLVMIFKLSLTSGLMQSFLLFAQTFFILNQVPSLIPVSKIALTFVSIHTLIVGFFNMHFFYMDEISFCLWRGATILDTIAFHYVTTLFGVLLLTFFILVLNQRVVNTKSIATQKFFNQIGKRFPLQKNSVVHGISAFLILSYTQYTLTSFKIITQLPIYREGGVIDQSVSFMQGNVQYFGVGHLPYAIPAVLVLVFLSFPPPLLLMSYPLLWKIKAKLIPNVGSGNDTTLWPIRKLLPLIDSFQGVFKDNYRLFAGLLFLWRIILTAIFSFASNLSEFFLLTEILLLLIFGIHTLARPYKQKIHNVIDELMLFNMALITLLKWYTSVPSSDTASKQAIDFLISLQLFLMYVPLVGFGAYGVFRLLKSFKVIPEQLKLPSPKNKNESKVCQGTKKTPPKQKRVCADEDLFKRASELNSFSTSVTCSEVGAYLETGSIHSTTLDTSS